MMDIAVGPDCNNACRGCLWTRRLEASVGIQNLPPSIPERIRLAGREPTLRDDLGSVVRGLRAAGAREIEIETNGRRLMYGDFTKQIADAGATRVTVKIFGNSAAVWDSYTRTPGSFLQTMAGIKALQESNKQAFSALLVPRREAGARLTDLIKFAKKLRFKEVRAALRLVKQDLTHLEELSQEIAEARALVKAFRFTPD